MQELYQVKTVSIDCQCLFGGTQQSLSSEVVSFSAKDDWGRSSPGLGVWPATEDLKRSLSQQKGWVGGLKIPAGGKMSPPTQPLSRYTAD